MKDKVSGCRRIAGKIKELMVAYLLAGNMTGVLSTYILPSMMDATPDSTPEPQHVLVEHKQNICCMDVSKGGLIATGSWDK
jgi:phospholipase A-2-activating protein